jgi:hypothetical protein
LFGIAFDFRLRFYKYGLGELKMRILGLAALAVALGGCASGQLNYNTLDIAGSVGDIFTRQALINLSAFVDDPFAIPSQLDISAGTVQTVNTVQPTLTFPLTAQIADTTTRAASSVTLANASTTAGFGGTLSGTNTQQQNWNVTPLTDANTLRNLQALYRHAVYGYPLNDVDRGYRPSRVFVGNAFFPDPYQLEQPHCVLCAIKPSILEANPSLEPNQRLASRWLYWTSDSRARFPSHMPPPNEAEYLHDLGHFGHYELYMKEGDFERGVLSDFVFFILPNSEPVEVFSAKVPSSTVGKDKKSETETGSAPTGKDAAAIAPSTNGRVSAGPGRHNLNVNVNPLGIQ